MEKPKDVGREGQRAEEEQVASERQQRWRQRLQCRPLQMACLLKGSQKHTLKKQLCKMISDYLKKKNYRKPQRKEYKSREIPPPTFWTFP